MASSPPSFFEAPTIAFITGASSGIGRAIALEFAVRFRNGLHLVLTGRSERTLQETSSLITSNEDYSSDRTSVRLVLGDLEDQESFPSLVERLFEDIGITEFQHAILVNNAGSTGDVTRLTRDFSPADIPEIQDFFFMNVTTSLLLASKFLSLFQPRDATEGTGGSIRRRTIVQMSSGASVRPTAAWSMYCTGKAARDMFHKVIAFEEPNVRVLSFSPGPVDTAMFRHGKDHSASPATLRMMAQQYEVMVTPTKAAGVLCDELEKDYYESGSRVSLRGLINPRAEPRV